MSTLESEGKESPMLKDLGFILSFIFGKDRLKSWITQMVFLIRELNNNNKQVMWVLDSDLSVRPCLGTHLSFDFKLVPSL